MTAPAPDPKSSKKSLIAIGVLAYVAAFLLYSVAWDVTTQTEIWLAPLLFSLVAVVVYVALGAILPSKWHLGVFSVGALIICLWSWDAPKTREDCVLREIKSARTEAAVGQVARMCYEKYRLSTNDSTAYIISFSNSREYQTLSAQDKVIFFQNYVANNSHYISANEPTRNAIKNKLGVGGLVN